MSNQCSDSHNAELLKNTMRLDELLNIYEIGEKLGTGAFSEVKVATHRKTGTKFAMKIIDKSKCRGKESMIEVEVNILKSVDHPHILKLYEMYEVEGKIYLVMELVTGGELFDEILRRGKYSEAGTAKIIQTILLALEYLHTKNIAHRDLKPENLLLSDRSRNPKIMISDFGLSKFFNEDEVMQTACGTPGYVAPEVLKRQGYGRKIDLWSIGVITYILLCGYPPFVHKDNVELMRLIRRGVYEFDSPWWDKVSNKAKSFVRHLLVVDPSKRYSARQALEHPFILDNCGVSPSVRESERSKLLHSSGSPLAPADLQPDVPTDKMEQACISPKSNSNLNESPINGSADSVATTSTTHSITTSTPKAQNLDQHGTPEPRPIGNKEVKNADSGAVISSNESVNSESGRSSEGNRRGKTSGNKIQAGIESAKRWIGLGGKKEGSASRV